MRFITEQATLPIGGTPEKTLQAEPVDANDGSTSHSRRVGSIVSPCGPFHTVSPSQAYNPGRACQGGSRSRVSGPGSRGLALRGGNRYFVSVLNSSRNGRTKAELGEHVTSNDNDIIMDWIMKSEPDYLLPLKVVRLWWAWGKTLSLPTAGAMYVPHQSERLRHASPLMA